MTSSSSAPVRAAFLRETISVGGKQFPVYVGFLAPSALTRIAKAPAFSEGERHEVIATDVMKPSAKNWQRPLDQRHWEGIAATFSSSSDVMPNAVLLSKNANFSGGVHVQPTVAGGSTMGTVTITIDPSGGHPLWIIDGQHRIMGLANSVLADEKIPVVLLLDEAHISVYNGPSLAKIFAQVTTQATELKPLHNDWLKYAFNLDRYSSTPQLHKSMTVVAKLASTPTYVDQTGNTFTNPFFDKIRFNDYLQVHDFQGVPFDCTELKDIVFKYYYNVSLLNGEFSADEIGCQIALAYEALIRTSKVPHDTHCVLSVQKDSQQVVVRNGFLAASLLHLADQGIPKTWLSLFVDLKFQSADWNFAAWTQRLHGIDNTRSFEIAKNIFRKIFRDGQLPAGVATVDLYFRGNSGEIVVETSKPTAAGRFSARSSNTKKLHPLILNQTINKVPISIDRFLRLDYTSPNLMVEYVEDLGTPRSDPRRHPELTKTNTIKGLCIDTATRSPLKLNFRIALFGGISRNCEVDVTW